MSQVVRKIEQRMLVVAAMASEIRRLLCRPLLPQVPTVTSHAIPFGAPLLCILDTTFLSYSNIAGNTLTCSESYHLPRILIEYFLLIV